MQNFVFTTASCGHKITNSVMKIMFYSKFRPISRAKPALRRENIHIRKL